MERSNNMIALETIRDLYSDGGKRKFILHLISAFLCNKVERYENNAKIPTCCILGINVYPGGSIPDGGEGGYISKKSDKVLSTSAYIALRKFVEYMAGMKDTEIMKMSKYIIKEEIPKKPRIEKEKELKESKSKYENIQAII